MNNDIILEICIAGLNCRAGYATAFLDTLITRNNGSLLFNVYRKPTHTDRYLDYNSHHDKQHKVSTAQTLLHREETLPNTIERKQEERKHINDTLICSGYLGNSCKKLKRNKNNQQQSCYPSLHQRPNRTTQKTPKTPWHQSDNKTIAHSRTIIPLN